jgi:PhnB protein
MDVQPYLFFGGDCREAMTRYHEVLGGQLDIMAMSDAPEGEAVPEGSDDMVMHAALMLGDTLLMASDDPTGGFEGVKGVAISVAAADTDEATRVFSALAEGGEVQMPLGETYWSPCFGVCVDRFGVSWMVGVNAPPED